MIKSKTMPSGIPSAYKKNFYLKGCHFLLHQLSLFLPKFCPKECIRAIFFFSLTNFLAMWSFLLIIKFFIWSEILGLNLLLFCYSFYRNGDQSSPWVILYVSQSRGFKKQLVRTCPSFSTFNVIIAHSHCTDLIPSDLWLMNQSYEILSHILSSI